MKLKLTCSSWSNITYKREEEREIDVTPEEWADMSEGERIAWLDGDLIEWVQEDLCFGAELSPEDQAKVDAIEGKEGA
jgi:hypothetical protein